MGFVAMFVLQDVLIYLARAFQVSHLGPDVLPLGGSAL
jgi:hypothetical protein